MMDQKGRREALRKMRDEQGGKAEKFNEMVGNLSIFAWKSDLPLDEFGVACEQTTEYAARVYGIFPDDGADDPPPTSDDDDDRAGFNGMMETAAFSFTVDGRQQGGGELSELRWSEEDNRHLGNIIGARLPDTFKYRHAQTSFDIRLGDKVAQVSVFFDWYSTAPYGLRATAMVQNCYPSQGWIDFADLAFNVSLGAHVETFAVGEDHGGCNTIRPRGVLPLRIHVHGNIFERLPIVQKAPAGLHEYLTHKRNDLNADFIGPYRIYWKGYHNLGDSHGGWGIPMHGGGARCWSAGDALGYMMREFEFLGTVARSPIVALNLDGTVFVPTTPYWLGDSSYGVNGDHTPPEYKYPHTDSACPYADQLASYQPPEYTHQWRMVRGAATCAPFDSAARWWLQQCWDECARWMRGTAVGDEHSNGLFWSWGRRLVLTPLNRGAGWAGRGVAHVVATFGAAFPYVKDAKRWRDTIVSGLHKIQMPAGNLLAGLQWEKSTIGHGGTGGIPAGTIEPTALRAAAREEQLMVCALETLPAGANNGETREERDMIDKLAHAIGMNPAEVYTVNADNDLRFVRTDFCPAYYPPYDHMTLYAWSAFPDAAACIEKSMRPDTPWQENPLDCTPRAMWEA